MWPDGGLAQLGERLLCKQEVIGSIPIVSTSFAVRACGDQVLSAVRKGVRLGLMAVIEVTTAKFRFGAVYAPQSVGVFAVARSALWAAFLRGSGVVVFCNVNQVLVRLWACRGQPSLTGCTGIAICLSPRPRRNTFRGVVNMLSRRKACLEAASASDADICRLDIWIGYAGEWFASVHGVT
jgi:hypothetical protein